MILRARLPPFGRGVGLGGTEPVCVPSIEDLGTGGDHAQVRTEHLVGRDGEHVGAQHVEVDDTVLGEVDAVDRHERACSLGA